MVLLDLDPQGSASAWLDVHDPGDDGRGLADVVLDEAKVGEFVLPTAVPGLDVVPSSPWLVSVERAAAGEPGVEMILARATSSSRCNRGSRGPKCPRS